MVKSVAVLALTVLFSLALLEIAQAARTWTEYGGNPIYGQGVGGPKAYYPSVLYDASSFSGHDGGYTSTYKMWYDSDPTTQLATSDDGLTWTNRGTISLSNVHHALVEYYPAGFGSGMYYRMWYWPGVLSYSINDLRYAESGDGINWTNDQALVNGSVPIVTGGATDWNRGSYGPADVLYTPGASNSGTDWTFRMYYDGTTGGKESLGVAFSSDGITWTGYDANTDGKADAVFTGTDPDAGWDYSHVSRATILRNTINYEMWYSGGDGNMQDGIGFATSDDGIAWVRQPRIFHKTDGVQWRSTRSYCPMVIRVTDGYQMWYAGMYDNGITRSYSIGYATGDEPTAVTGVMLSARTPAVGVGVWLGLALIALAAAWMAKKRRR